MMDPSLTTAAVEAALADFLDPDSGRSVVETGQLRETRVDSGGVSVTLGLTTHSAILRDDVKAQLEHMLRSRFAGAGSVTINIVDHARPPEKLGDIGLTSKTVIAVGSGKGGVGKSTIATALAVGLARAGSKVGLLDADVYGPSVPHLLGINRKPTVEQGRIQPIEVAGLKAMSMGFLVPAGEAVVWRGPMLHGAITQLLRDTAWGNLDYLFIDMPPGTGDIALTLSQLVPLTGAVVVCTPQDVALLDAVKAIAMFRKVNIPILGIVENMSGFVCPDCGKRHDIFGRGGARRRATELDVPFLGEAPISIPIREHGDQGEPQAAFDDPTSASYLNALCLTLARNLANARREKQSLSTLPALE